MFKLERSLEHVRVIVCHDQVSLSEVMNLYCFVYDFVILSFVDDYDGVFGNLV